MSSHIKTEKSLEKTLAKKRKKFKSFSINYTKYLRVMSRSCGLRDFKDACDVGADLKSPEFNGISKKILHSNHIQDQAPFSMTALTIIFTISQKEIW